MYIGTQVELAAAAMQCAQRGGWRPLSVLPTLGRIGAMDRALSGQTAIVTGGATGIGEAISARLAASGATVAIVDLDLKGAEDVASAIGGGAFAIRADITQSAEVDRAVSAVLARTGRIDILVNDAGMAGKAAPIWEQTNEDWDRNIALNLTAIFYFCRAVVPHMRERGYERIVTIASIAGKEGNPRMIAYSASKAGVIGLTKSLGKEVATDGVCVNAVAPAVVRNADSRSVDAGAGAVYDRSDSHKANGDSGGGRGGGALFVQSGMFVRDGAVLRLQRGPGYVLEGRRTTATHCSCGSGTSPQSQ